MIRKYFGQIKLVLLCFDIFFFSVAYILSYWIRHGLKWPLPHAYLWGGLFFLGGLLFCFQRLGLYKLRMGRIEEAVAVVKGISVTFLLILASTFFYRGFSYSRLSVIYFAPVLLVYLLAGRELFRKVHTKISRALPIARNTLIIGGGNDIGKNLMDELLAHPSIYRLIGFLDDEDSGRGYSGIPRLGGFQDLDRIVKTHNVVNVLIAVLPSSQDVVLNMIRQCEENNVQWRIVPDLYNLPLLNIAWDALGGVPLIGPPDTNIVGINFLIKRGFDLLAGTVLIVLLSPLMLVIAVLIKLTSDGPILYKQQRIGLHMKPFIFYKFRTMIPGRSDRAHKEYVAQWIRHNQAHHRKPDGKQVFKIDDDPRVTTIGKWLRKFSLDELPQLFNVLKGDMSLVGPRPAIPYEVELYRPEHKKRFHAPPGITGPWQINGRNRLSFQEMIHLDINYINNWSLENDIIIILRTIFVVFFEKAY